MFSAKRKNICFSNGCGSIYLSLSLKSLNHQVLGTLCNRHQSCSLWIHCFIAYSINRYASLLQTSPFATYQPPYFAVQNEVLLFKIISTHNRISSALLIQLQSCFPLSSQQRTVVWRRLLPIPSFLCSGILMEIVWCKRKSFLPFPAAFFFHSSHSVTVQLFLFAVIWLFLGDQNWQFYTICRTQQRSLRRQVQPDSAYTPAWLHTKQCWPGSSCISMDVPSLIHVSML